MCVILSIFISKCANWELSKTIKLISVSLKKHKTSFFTHEIFSCWCSSVDEWNFSQKCCEGRMFVNFQVSSPRVCLQLQFDFTSWASPVSCVCTICCCSRNLNSWFLHFLSHQRASLHRVIELRYQKIANCYFHFESSSAMQGRVYHVIFDYDELETLKHVKLNFKPDELCDAGSMRTLLLWNSRLWKEIQYFFYQIDTRVLRTKLPSDICTMSSSMQSRFH